MELKEWVAAESLQAFMAKEAALDVIKLNGENNHKLIKDKTSWKYKYTSTTRTVLRNLWLCDFIYHLMYNLDHDRTHSLGHCAKDAYSKGLGPHHPWIVRNGAKVAMMACPSRESFISHCEFTYEQIGEVRDALLKIKEPLWEEFKKNKWEELP